MPMEARRHESGEAVDGLQPGQELRAKVASGKSAGKVVHRGIKTLGAPAVATR